MPAAGRGAEFDIGNLCEHGEGNMITHGLHMVELTRGNASPAVRNAGIYRLDEK